MSFCHDRNSSIERVYRSQASSIVISPARTPATTSALRRMTQRLVPGGGRSFKVIGAPSGPITASDLPGRSDVIRYPPSSLPKLLHASTGPSLRQATSRSTKPQRSEEHTSELQ